MYLPKISVGPSLFPPTHSPCAPLVLSHHDDCDDDDDDDEDGDGDAHRDRHDRPRVGQSVSLSSVAGLEDSALSLGRKVCSNDRML